MTQLNYLIVLYVVDLVCITLEIYKLPDDIIPQKLTIINIIIIIIKLYRAHTVKVILNYD